MASGEASTSRAKVGGNVVRERRFVPLTHEAVLAVTRDVAGGADVAFDGDEASSFSGDSLSEPEFWYAASGDEVDPFVDLEEVPYIPRLNLWDLMDDDIRGKVPPGGELSRLRRRRLYYSARSCATVFAPRQPQPDLRRTFPVLRSSYSISEDIELLSVRRLDRQPRHSSGIRLSVGFFKAGLRLPFDPLIVDVLNYYLKAPAQMTATFYRIMSFLMALRDQHQYVIGLDEVRTVFMCKPGVSGPRHRDLQRAGRLTYSLARRAGLGLFVPPNKHAYKDDKVVEVYGSYEPVVEGVVKRIRCKAFTDYGKGVEVICMPLLSLAI